MTTRQDLAVPTRRFEEKGEPKEIDESQSSIRKTSGGGPLLLT